MPSMALILLVKVQSRVFTAKCSEPQAGVSNGMGGGSGVAKFLTKDWCLTSGDPTHIPGGMVGKGLERESDDVIVGEAPVGCS